MILAQALGEYGALSAGIARVITVVDGTTQWVQDRPVWLIVAVCLVLGFWVFRRR